MIPHELEAAYGREELVRRLLRQRRMTQVRADMTPSWEWTGGLDADGYGRISLPRSRRQHWPVHRVAAVVWFDDFELESSSWICHRCDHRQCFNPDHLYAGTPRDNYRDMRERGRAHPPPRFRGEDHPNARLKTDDVVDMREAYAAGRSSQPELARQFGVSESTIGAVVTGEAWKHAPGPITLKRQFRGEAHPCSRLTEQQVIEIRLLAAEKAMTTTELARRFNVARKMICNVVAGKTWRHVVLQEPEPELPSAA